MARKRKKIVDCTTLMRSTHDPMQVAEIARDEVGPIQRLAYRRPHDVSTVDLPEALRSLGRSVRDVKQFDLLRVAGESHPRVHCAGDFNLLRAPTVSVVGTREVSPAGAQRASRLARELAKAGIVVMSGLAKGVDTAALTAAIQAGGRVAAVIGTPLSKAYPAENAHLQEDIYAENLLISPFSDGEKVHRSNFPKRNRVMALLSDATVIIEASDTSGTLHQASECLRQNRWLFILSSVVRDEGLSWPKKFLGKDRVVVLVNTDQIITELRAAQLS